MVEKKDTRKITMDISLKKRQKLIIKPFQTILKWSQERVEFYGAQNQFFGGFVIINLIVPYFLWIEPGGSDDLALRLRFFGGILCGGVIAREYWLPKFKCCFSLFWYFSVTYCLIFYNFYMFLNSPASPFWLTQVAIGLFLLAYLVDSRTILFLLSLGILTTVGSHLITFGRNAVFLDTQTVLLISYLIITAYIFNRFKTFVTERNSRAHNRRNLVVAEHVASIVRAAYAQSTPALAALKDKGPHLIQGFIKAKNANLVSDSIEDFEIKLIETLATELGKQMVCSEQLIDLELGKLQDLRSMSPHYYLQKHSISDCIETALDLYPFAVGEKMLVGWQGGNDFHIKVDQKLFTQMIFNLLRNSLEQVAHQERGKISIWIEREKRKNYLYFKDTVGSADPREVPFFFDPFYSKTPGRIGMGLTFCKRVMHLFNGKIRCQVKSGRQTVFSLSFPIVDAPPTDIKLHEKHVSPSDLLKAA